MRTRWLLGLGLWSGLSVHAQMVNVRGTISGADGKPVSGAIVTLMKIGLKDTTGADGAFSLVKSASGLMGLRSGSTSFSLIGSVLECRLPAASVVSLEVFDVGGNRLKADRRTAAKPGILRWDIAGEFPADRLLILRASAGGEVAVFRHIPLAGGFSGSAAVQSSGLGARVSAKAAAAVDSLEVKAPGFDTKVVEVSVYDGIMNVALAVASDRWGGLRNAPVKSDGCGKPLSIIKAGTNTYKITSAGLDREYIATLPDNYDPNKPYRLVFGMHWMQGSDKDVQGWSQWFWLKPQDKEATTIFVAPNGTGNPPLWTQGAKDHTLFEDLVNLFESDLCIDKSRIFSVGFSFGAMFSNSLAQTHQDILRGIVVYEAADVNIYFPANNGKPMAYMGVHGINDKTCTIESGRRSINRFVKNNGCTVPAMVPEAKRGGNYVTYDYKCPSSYPARWITFDGAHTYPPNNNGTWVHPLAWQFITQF